MKRVEELILVLFREWSREFLSCEESEGVMPGPVQKLVEGCLLL